MSKHNAVPFLEQMIFHNRLVVLFLFLLVSVFLGYQALQIKPDASLERLIPLEHPFIQNMMENRADLQNLGNAVRISVAVSDGDIFNAEYMEALQQITDEVFYLNGVNRAALKSVWTPNVRWSEVTEQGFQGGTVIPDGYSGSSEDLEALRQNILKSGEVGRLVADDFKSSIIYAPLMEINPQTNERLNYQMFSDELEEKVRLKYQQQYPDIRIHIIGFAKKIGDLIEGFSAIAWFALITVGLTLLFLLVYSRCITGTLVPVFTSIIAVFWQLGLLRLLGFGVDPYSVLMPFLVFAIGISHGVQIVNAIALETSRGSDSMMAARLAFRQLYIPGLIALVSDAFGFLTLLYIEIDVIRDLAISAGIGIAVIIITNLVIHPVIISYIGISRRGVAHVQHHGIKVDRKWRYMSYFAHSRLALVSICVATLGLGLGLYYQKDLKIGDIDAGAPELRPDSRYNQDNDFITRHYSTSSDTLVIMVDTSPDMCSSYPVLDAMDRLEWHLMNTAGVESVSSLVTVSKIVTKAMNEGSLKWFSLPSNQRIVNTSIQRAPAGLINPDCSMTPMVVYLADHKAETLSRVVDTIQMFVEQHPSGDYQFLMAAGNAGIEAATNEVIIQAKDQMLLFVYAVVSFLCLLTFRSWRAVVCIVTPLALTSVLCEALMAQLGIGVKVATLPVIALGVGIGVDYGIYIYTRLEKELRLGKTLQQAYYNTLISTGKAVSFTGLTLGVGVITWVFSPIKFQADMGVLLFFMFIWNMVGALCLLPALASVLLKSGMTEKPARSATA